MGAVAEFERDLIRERTRAGVAAAKRRGKRIGRPRAHVQVGEAQALMDRGKSLASVAKALGVARSTLQRALPKKVSAEAAVRA